MNRAEVRRRQAGELSDILTLAAMLILGRQTGNNGIVYMTVAAVAYGLLLTVVCGNLPDTLGRLLRGRKNKGQYRNAERMRRSAMIQQLILGIAGSGALCIFSGSIAGMFGIPYSGFIMAVLSPAVFLRSVTSVFMGYFQGEGSELPTAAAGILRAVFIFGFGILFSGLLRNYGEKVGSLLREDNFAAMYGGMGVALAVSLAELLVVIFLALIYKIGDWPGKKARQEGYATETSFDCVRYLWAGRWQQAATAFLEILPLGLGLFFFALKTEDEAAFVSGYGVYAGGYLVFCGAAVSLISMLVLPAVSKIFSSLRKSEHRFARTAFEGGMHICLVHSIFTVVFVAVMGEQIGELLCPENAEAVLPMLRGGSCVIAFAALSCYFTRFLQTAGKRYPVLLAACIADLLFLAIIMATCKAGILSLVYSGMAGTFVLCVMLGVLACAQMRVRFNWLDALAVPAGASAAAGLLCMLTVRLIAPHVHILVTLLVAFVLAEAVYWGALILLRNFKDPELDAIPGGRLISGLKQMLHIY